MDCFSTYYGYHAKIGAERPQMRAVPLSSPCLPEQAFNCSPCPLGHRSPAEGNTTPGYRVTVALSAICGRSRYLPRLVSARRQLLGEVPFSPAESQEARITHLQVVAYVYDPRIYTVFFYRHVLVRVVHAAPGSPTH